jgi:hypothetical protein
MEDQTKGVAPIRRKIGSLLIPLSCNNSTTESYTGFDFSLYESMFDLDWSRCGFDIEYSFRKNNCLKVVASGCSGDEESESLLYRNFATLRTIYHDQDLSCSNFKKCYDGILIPRLGYDGLLNFQLCVNEENRDSVFFDLNRQHCELVAIATRINYNSTQYSGISGDRKPRTTKLSLEKYSKDPVTSNKS